MKHVRIIKFCRLKSRKTYTFEVSFKSHQDAKKFKNLMFDDSDNNILIGFDNIKKSKGN